MFKNLYNIQYFKQHIHVLLLCLFVYILISEQSLISIAVPSYKGAILQEILP